jgi:hypothetical protein
MGHNGAHRTNGHLTRAIQAISRAKVEFATARKAKDEMAASQAAEKAWLAVAEATHAFLRCKGFAEDKLPKGQNGAFLLLRKHGTHDLVKTFLTARGILHTEAFYRGSVDWPTIAEVIGEAEGFVTRVRSVAERN